MMAHTLSMSANITDPIFHNEEAAQAHIEASRWNGEPSCPHCGSLKVRRMEGETQAGMFLCNDCRDKFTVRTGSVIITGTLYLIPRRVGAFRQKVRELVLCP
jgi:transposase-like protein